MAKPILHALIASALLSVSLVHPNPQAQVKVHSRIPSMVSEEELAQRKHELEERYKQLQAEIQGQPIYFKKYTNSQGLASLRALPSPASELQKELLFELLPRQVTELGLRLRIRHLLGYHDEKPINTVLFHGPPGLGKTEAAAMVARQGGFRFVEQPSTGLVDKYQNSGAEKFQAIIDEAIKHYENTKEESFIFMDEFDAIGRDLNDADATMVTNHQTEQAALMHIWQTVLKYKDDKRFVFCFGTNKLKVLHKTFISRFREEHIIEFKLPDTAQRELAFKHYLKAYDFSLAQELHVSESEAEQVLQMLVKSSNGMNYRAIRDSVRSFKGQKSLSSLSNDDLILVAKHLKEHDKVRFEELQKRLASTKDNKIDAAIIAIYEEITGKEAAAKASTSKELYEIVQRTKSKDGYDWQEQIKKWNESLSKNVDPWLHRSHLYYILGAGLIYGGYQFFAKQYINPKGNPDLDAVITQKVKLELIRLGLLGSAAAAGAVAGAFNPGAVANNGSVPGNNPFSGPFG